MDWVAAASRQRHLPNDIVMIIDAHVHFWKYERQRDAWITNDMKTLQQDYLPEHLLPVLKRNEIDGVVAVQADQSELETHFLVEMARTHGFIKAVVGWIDFREAEIEKRLAYFSQYPVIKGWRHIVQAEPAGFLTDPSFLKGIRMLQQYGYTYDLLIREHQLAEAVAFARELPEQPIVVDHMAKPAIHKKEFAAWEKGIRSLAALPNVYCKLSGLLTEANWKQWSAADFYPCLDVVMDAFGTQRLMFGSDWPVMLLSGIYVQWKSLIEKYMENLSGESKAAIMGGNAIDFYHL